LYVSFPAEVEQPPRVLRGFGKVNITVGQAMGVKFSLRRRDLSYWDTAAQQWALAEGTYTFFIGSSSRDLLVNTTIAISRSS
jgi:beta-glucosidase